MNKLYANEEINRDGYKVIVKAELDQSALGSYEEKVLDQKRNNVSIPGFRPGEAPLDLVKKHIGEEEIKQEALKQLSADALSHIIITHKLKVIGVPNINISNEGGKPHMSADLTILPEIKLGDYVKIAKKHNAIPEDTVDVTDDDIQQVFTHLRREKARISILEQAQKNNSTPDFSTLNDDNLPELNESDFKELGGVSTEEDFRKKIGEQIKKEKEIAQKDKKRLAMLDEMIENSSIEVPEEIIDLEIQRTESQLKQDLQMMGMDMEKYLSQIGKSIDELKNEWKEPAKKRAQLQMLLDAIAEKEGIKPKKEDIEKEVEHILSHHPNANKQEVYAFVDAQKSNQSVIDYLESLK